MRRSGVNCGLCRRCDSSGRYVCSEGCVSFGWGFCDEWDSRFVRCDCFVRCNSFCKYRRIKRYSSGRRYRSSDTCGGCEKCGGGG